MTDDGQGVRPASWPAETRQEQLIERAKEVLSRDGRVLGVWLAGTFARGTNDPFSDVDLWVVVEERDLDTFCDDWPTTVDAIAPTVLQRQVGDRPVFSQVTRGWLRFDVSIGTPAEIPGRTRSTVRPLYDPAGLSVGLGDPRPPRQPDPEVVGSLTLEFLRVLGLLPVVVGRGEYVVGLQGAGLSLSLLIDLMREDVAVEDRGGALSLNRLLPPDRLQSLLDLPPLQAARDSVIGAHRACAALFLPLARDLHVRRGLAWPQDLDDSVREHLETTLDLRLPP